MNAGRLQALIAVTLMLGSVAAAGLVRPTERVADDRQKFVLETLVPKRFGQWSVDEAVVPILPSPDVQQALNKIYNQILARTYVAQDGQRIMLTVAYGGDQSDNLRVHKPEGCYAFQGFQVLPSSRATLVVGGAHLPVTRLVARLGQRNEPITYWVKIADQVTLGSLDEKLAQLKFGLTGKIPDGMLVRVSSIQGDSASAFALHEIFVKDLLDALSENDRAVLVGTLARASGGS